jgi:hypothetical protein
MGAFLPLNAQNAANSDPTYQALRSLALGSESVEVNDLYLRREAGTFHLRSGTICFAAAVQGKVTGAAFVGDGSLALAVPPSEVDILKLLTKESGFSENFSQMVLRFTDSTYEEIKKAAKPAAANCDAGTWKESQRTTREILKNNLEVRILEDLIGNQSGGLFVAFVHGKRYSAKNFSPLTRTRVATRSCSQPMRKARPDFGPPCLCPESISAGRWGCPSASSISNLTPVSRATATL